MSENTKRWYVIHAYSGFENYVIRDLRERIRLKGLEDKFGEIIVPTEEVVLATSGVSSAKFLAYLDTTVGAVTGFYVPFTKWARNDDCYSNFI
jgi:transcription antitermination factor NusG